MSAYVEALRDTASVVLGVLAVFVLLAIPRWIVRGLERVVGWGRGTMGAPVTLQTFYTSARRITARLWTGTCWLFAPVATSLKGALDRNDFRPVLAKMIVLGGAAGAGIKAAFRDPEVMGAAAVLLIAVLSGMLEAISRANQCPPPNPSAPDPSATVSELREGLAMQNIVHDSGLGVGWALIAVGNFLHFVADHGMTALSAASILFGMFCQGYAVWLRHCDRRNRRPQRRP